MSRKTPPRRRAEQLGLWTLWLLFMLLPVACAPAAHESFRLPKLLIAESLALASLVFLTLRLRSVGRIDWRAVLRQPVLWAALPMLAVATSGLLTSDHDLHVRDGLASLWIGTACLIGWSLALDAGEHRRLLDGLILPAVVLSVLAILQFHRLFNPFRFEEQVGERIGLTSLAGGAFDLAAFLALPCLVAQLGWHEATGARRWAWAAAGLTCGYAMVASQTLAALVALGVSTLVLWFVLLPRRRFAAVAAVVAFVGVASGLGFGPLRERLDRKLESLRTGNLNRVVTGRLDGWRAAAWMVREKPWTGVGHGAYRAAYGNARLALASEGVAFYSSQHRAYFVNAHSDVLEALAEWGLPGGAALAWGVFVLARAHRRMAAVAARHDVALAWAGLVALAILAVTNFPLRIALTAYPAILFLSWIFATSREAGPAGGRPAGGRPAGGRP